MFLSLKKSLIGLIVVALLSSTHSFSAMALSLDTIVNANEKIYSEKNKNNHTKYYDFLLNEKKQFLMNDEENSVNATTTFDDTKNNNTNKTNDNSNINNTGNKENSNLTNTENNNTTNASNDTTSNENLSPDNANQDDTENNEEPEEDEVDNKKENEDNKIENKNSNTENNNNTSNDTNNENNNDNNENTNENGNSNTENDKVDTENTEQEKVEVVVDDDVIEDDKTDFVVSDTPVLNDAVDNLNDNNTVNNEAVEVDVASDSETDISSEILLFGTGEKLKIGNTIEFGKYKQDMTTNIRDEDAYTPTNIVWSIIDIDEQQNEATLIATKVLDCTSYSFERNYTIVNYANSNIREFLNNYFYNTAFSDEEKCYIMSRTDICSDKIEDKVWILSRDEFRNYVSKGITKVYAARNTITKYAHYRAEDQNHNYDVGNTASNDWAKSRYYVRDFNSNSSISSYPCYCIVMDSGYDTCKAGNYKDDLGPGAGVRPCIKVNLSLLGYNADANTETTELSTEYSINWDLAEGSFKDEYKDVYENAKHNDQEDYILPTKDKLVAPYNKVFKEWTIDGIATTSISKDIHKEVTVVANWTRSVGNFESYSIGKYKVSSLDTEDEQDLEWIVLDKTNGKLLLTTKNIIDTKTYDKNGNAEFKNSTIKTWLNNDFYNQVFDNNQKENIVKEENNEKVFLLTKEQANEYFGNNVQRVARATDHSQHVDNDGETLDATNDIACYWLTSDTNNGKAPYVSKMGEVIEDGIDVKTKTIGVRPCIWVMENKIADIRMKPLQKILNAIGNQWNSFIGFMNKLFVK